MVSIKEESYKTLIRNSILYFDDNGKIFGAFEDFLETNGMLSELLAIEILESRIDIDNLYPYYERLAIHIEYFIKLMTIKDVENPAKNAEYILNYLYVIYYRAIGRRYCLHPERNAQYGMTYEEAYGFLSDHGGRGLIHYFRMFCLSKNLPLAFFNEEEGDLFFFLATILPQATKIIKETDDESFNEIYSSFRHSGGFLDYRLYARIFLELIKEIETRKDLLSPEEITYVDTKILVLEDFAEEISNRPEKVDFQEYTSISKSTWTLCFMTHEHFQDIENKLSKRGKEIIKDLATYGSMLGKVKTFIDNLNISNGHTSPHYGESGKTDLDYLKDLLNEETVRRSDELYEKMRKKRRQIKPEDIKGLVVRFLKSGMFDGGKERNPYPDLVQSFQNTGLDYEALYEKLAKDKEAVELLADTQKEMEDMVPNGLIYNDYSKLTFVPSKIIERMLKTEIYNHYGNHPILSKVEKIPPEPNEKYPHNPYKIAMGCAETFIKNILNSNAPWFIKETGADGKNSIFYNEFVNKSRNGYFHVDVIKELLEGRENYRKVAFWFVEVLAAFDPFI